MEYKNLGLVVEGGASRAYYACGVMDGLLDAKIYADYVVGTSAGIANAVSYVSRQKGRNYKIGTEYTCDKRYMAFKYMLKPKVRSYYNMDFVMNEIPNKHVPFDFDTFRNFKGEIEATVTNIRTGKAEYLPVSRNDRKFTVLHATCALPILFKPVKIHGEEYMDGGIADSIPVNRAFDCGCEKAIVILTQPRDYRKKHDKSLDLSAKLYKKYPDFAKALLSRPENYNKTLENIEELEKQGKVFVIAPNESLGIKRTERSPKEIDRIFNQGIRDFENLKDELLNFLGNN